MIDISEVINDPEFQQNFTCFRSSGNFDEGGYVETVAEIALTGVVLPTNSRDLQQIPEGDRITGGMSFYTTSELFVTHNGEGNTKGTSDKLQWRNELYKIVKLLPYVDYGYFKALAVRITGD